MSAVCKICGKEFKNTQGLRGHMRFVHQVTNSKESPTGLNTKQGLSKPENITGIRELSELERLLSNTEKLLTEQVSDLTKQVSQLNEQVNQPSEQVSKLTEQLKSEYVSRETIETIATELTGKFESLHKEIVTTYKMLAVIVRKNLESCENRFSKIEGQVTTTTNQLYELSKTVKHVQESVQSNRASISQLNTKLVSLEHALSELENGVARVKNLTRRVPTGEIVGIQLSDKREHHFREYKNSEALARPYRTKRDLILGDRWVDLTEPED